MLESINLIRSSMHYVYSYYQLEEGAKKGKRRVRRALLQETDTHETLIICTLKC
jgi:hypothetical protein